MTIPTKSMKAGEEDYSIACVVPVNAPGVKIINTTYAPRHEDTRDFPVSASTTTPEGFVIFDDVFVPHERVFLDGETTTRRRVRPLASGCGSGSAGCPPWRRRPTLVGFAQLIAEANGTAGRAHIREKISEMIIHATLIRATLEAAIANCHITARGRGVPQRAVHQRRQVPRRGELQR
jgi:4-hydroxybutyryl-CoA dehydratase / vinylacetyl-CoA-Delta-isomerase